MDSDKPMQALKELRDRLIQELKTPVDPEREGALNVAIRGLINAIDV